jgi:hypothetical protein
VYGLDGLKVGGGIEGPGFTNGGGAEGAGSGPGAREAEFAPAACTGSIARHAPKKAITSIAWRAIDIRLTFGVRRIGFSLEQGLNACLLKLLMKGQIKIVLPLHSLLKEIQEWIAVICRFGRVITRA